MSYDSSERARQGAAPFEVFRFSTPSKVYRYANHSSPQIVGVEVYTPVAGGCKRNDIDGNAIMESKTSVDIELSNSLPLFRDIALGKTPDYIFAQIFRSFSNEQTTTQFRQVWAGDVMGVAFDGLTLTLSSQSSLASTLDRSNNTVYYQKTCNHTLYDGLCKVSRGVNTESVIVASIGVTAIAVTGLTFAQGELIAGDITNTRTGETRIAIDNILDTISLDGDFFDLEIGDTLNVSRGCVRSRQRCTEGFNNGDNFGGFLHIPTTNPIIGRM